MSFLKISGVSKSFAKGSGKVEILKDINLEIQKGEFVALVGYSGSGKTTLISLISGLLKPDVGQVTLNGSTITGPGPDRGVVFQNYSLLPWLTVYQNIHLAVEQVFPDWSAEKKDKHTLDHIAMVSLSQARDKKPKELSGGMRQRVALARALAMDPQLLLMDEPLGALDALNRAKLQDEISAIWAQAQKTVVMITNDIDEGIYLADRIIPLSHGPGATLGPSIPINLPRPRSRLTMTHTEEFKEAKLQVLEFLLKSNSQKKTSVAKTLTLPNIEPEDLGRKSFPWNRRKTPIRKTEIKNETIQIET